MPKFKVLAKSFIDNHLVNEGDEIEYDPPAGTSISSNLEPLDKAAKSLPQYVAGQDAKRLAAAGQMGDPGATAALIA